MKGVVMILDSITFPTVFDESHHDYFRSRNTELGAATFVARPTTLLEHKEPLQMDHPAGQTIRTMLKGAGLRPISLAGSGAESLFACGVWQGRQRPFVISFAAAASTVDERIRELKVFLKLFGFYRSTIKAPVALQIHLDHLDHGGPFDDRAFTHEAWEALSQTIAVNVPVIVRCNVRASAEAVKNVLAHCNCSAVSVSSAVPWGTCNDTIDWKELFGTTVSPLADVGGGNLYGAPVFPLLINWMIDLDRAKRTGKPVIVGGVWSRRQACHLLHHAGAQGVFLDWALQRQRWWRPANIVHAFAEQEFGAPPIQQIVIQAR